MKLLDAISQLSTGVNGLFNSCNGHVVSHAKKCLEVIIDGKKNHDKEKVIARHFVWPAACKGREVRNKHEWLASF